VEGEPACPFISRGPPPFPFCPLSSVASGRSSTDSEDCEVRSCLREWRSIQMQNPEKARKYRNRSWFHCFLPDSFVPVRLHTCINRDVQVSVDCFLAQRAPGLEKLRAVAICGSSTSGIALRFGWTLEPALENSGCDHKMGKSYRYIRFLSTIGVSRPFVLGASLRLALPGRPYRLAVSSPRTTPSQCPCEGLPDSFCCAANGGV
jgi:hypothetical protein